MLPRDRVFPRWRVLVLLEAEPVCRGPRPVAEGWAQGQPPSSSGGVMGEADTSSRGPLRKKTVPPHPSPGAHVAIPTGTALPPVGVSEGPRTFPRPQGW